uniref:Uncharacterized protein n=1 Tax=viral metagenome TaxID=1070528 RepID=A0A6C0F0C2_9ZZZZ
MLRRELEQINSKEKHTVSFFEDDSIQVLREQIAKSADSHPDRMFILVAVKLPADYYKNPLHWEGLFVRLSYNGKPIEKKPFSDYQLNYRFPNTAISHKSYDRAEWMEYPSELEQIHSPTSEFIEYRILGVEEKKSFILPLDSDDSLVNRISSANIPVPQNNVLVWSLYPGNIERFIYDFHTDEKSSYHYPLLTSETPKVLSLESIRLLDKNAKLLTDLLYLKVEQEGSPNIIKTKFYIPWIETDFGSAVRTRFEQLFYGLTVSKDVPYICLFTSNDDTNRHKFFVEDVKNKEPYLNMSWWTSWTNISKPQRNIPTLLLYRGQSKHHFDRIAITANDMIISSYRPESNKETLSEIQKSCNKWLGELDSILPYIHENNIKTDRWELQDLSYVLKYDSNVDLSLLRFNCISSIYGIPDKTKSVFTLLRNDHESHGISALEIKIIQMMREGPIDPDAVAEELSMTRENAKKLISSVTGKLEENSRLGARLFRGYPTVSFGPNFAIVSTVTEQDRSSKYVDILRYILSSEESEDLNKICPPRLQKVDVESAIINTEQTLDAAVINEYDDLFDESFDPAEKVETETEVEAESVAESQTLATVSKQTTNYGYFHSKLQEFDPETFPEKSLYPKKCNLKHQPVVLTDKDKKELADPTNKNKGEGKYDPYKTSSEDKRLDVERPDGTLICPEYWCMKNEIPLREEDLVFDEEGAHCPVCMGKLQTGKNADVRQYPLIKRDTGFNFPGYMKYNSPSNGKVMPCCYKTPYTKSDKEVEVKDKYYVFKTNHRDLKPGRLAKLDEVLIRSLHLSEKYTLLDNQRIPESASGFFRVGMGNIIETLPNFLGMKVAIPSPKNAVETVMKCSFFFTWSKTSDTHVRDIEGKNANLDRSVVRMISGIEDAFSNKELSPIEQLEYAAISLNCDVFRVSIDTMKVGCLFYTPLVRQKTRAIAILQSNSDIDILSYVKRAHSGFGFISNVYDDPFKKDTVTTLETLRNSSCSSDIPSYEVALGVIEKIYTGDSFSIILDPFGRGQALYIPDKVVLPFKSTPLPDSEYSRIAGYQNIDRLPTLDTMKENLVKATESSNGYEFQEELFNSRNQVVEILTKSGLRIPVKPEDGKNGEALQVLESIRELGEDSLVFGESSEELKNVHSEISYESEVYEFLLFQLTKDLQVTNFDGLRDSLNESPLRRKAVEPRLKRWFEKFVAFVDIDKPHEFISKIRTPCGQFKKTPELCNKGGLCAWDAKDKICKINIKKTIKQDKLFNRLFGTLFNNSKIRSMVLDGRTTPFFSTILYISLPHELIVTDNQISSILTG